MTARNAILAATCLAAAVAAGCNQDRKTSDDGSSMSGSSDMKKPLEGNPGATTGPSVGYPQSDPHVYHPQTDDTHQYHPANPNNIQPTTQP